MKINDIILSEGIGDTLGSLAYRVTGGLMPGGKTAEARRIFVNTFERELDAARKSAAKSGVPLNVGTFLKTYMQKNGFSSAGYTKEIQKYLPFRRRGKCGKFFPAVGAKCFRSCNRLFAVRTIVI